MNEETAIRLEASWKEKLSDVITSTSFSSLRQFVRSEYACKTIFPKPKDIFKAFELTPFDTVTVVILGQDPYHDDGQAHGLAFSVPSGVRLPPSLANIYKEIQSDCGVVKDCTSGNLEAWAIQGVLLLNTILTVVAHTPASHRGKGWEEFTDAVIRTVSNDCDHVVFMLWGKYAQSKRHLIDAKKHCVLEAPHPSPFSAHTGFFGCKHFSRCNEYLISVGKKPIVW